MKHERGHKKLEKVAQWIMWVVWIAIALLFVRAFMDIAALDDYYDETTVSTLAILVQYAAYGMLLYIVGEVISQTLLHFQRMEIIALDGADAFEPEEVEEDAPVADEE